MPHWLPKKISLKPPIPWMTPAILASKQYRRYLERVWCRNPTALNRSRLTRQTHLCNRQMSKAKLAHCSKLIAEHSGDHGSLWKAFNKILHHCPKLHLPNHSSIVALANTFSSFFINKISVICSSSPLTHTHVCWILVIPGRFYRIYLLSLPMRCTVLSYRLHASLLT